MLFLFAYCLVPWTKVIWHMLHPNRVTGGAELVGELGPYQHCEIRGFRAHSKVFEHRVRGMGHFYFIIIIINIIIVVIIIIIIIVVIIIISLFVVYYL